MRDTIQIDFGHRSVDVTVSDVRRWTHPDATPADHSEARRALRFKDTPEALAAALGILRDVARQVPGAALFDCISCGSATYGADGVIGPELCGHCYELAGIDNACNDSDRAPDAGELAEIRERLDAIAAAGGNVERAVRDCAYLAPHVDC